MRRALIPSLLLSLAIACGSGIPHAAAQQDAAPTPEVTREQELARLFADLAAATHPADAAGLRKDIWNIWMRADSPSIDLLMSRATDALEQDNLHHAIELLDTVTALAPTYAEGWNKRATALHARWQRENLAADLERSLADIARTLELEPRHFGALSGLAMIRDSQGDTAAAAAARARIRDLMPLLP